jgi:Protein of unknown function (DUF2867)
MSVQAVKPEIDTVGLLPGAQFADAYCVAVDGVTHDARHAAEKMLSRGPRWIDALLALRNHLVKPFGLKTPPPNANASAQSIGIFPVVGETPDRLVAGFNDSHLDFRVVVDVATSGDSQRVTLTTLVLTHNLLGRVYLAIILPFHRLIARAMLRQVAA